MNSNNSFQSVLKLGLLIIIPVFCLFCANLASSQKKIEQKKDWWALINKPNLPKMSLAERIKSIEPTVSPRISEAMYDLKQSGNRMAIVVFKKEKLVEVWTDVPPRKKIKAFRMTKSIGDLGPKNKSGDYQIPEGVYKVTHLNPNSQYYLSIGLNYPNENDKKRAKLKGIKSPGGDIFIHGRAKTVGCVPIGDHWIEELFLMVHKVGKAKVKVLIAPSSLPIPDLEALKLDPSKNSYVSTFRLGV